MSRLLPTYLTVFLLTSCSVYVPLQPTMPLVEESKQVEVVASLQPTMRLEVAGAYSPLPHMVVTGAGTVGLVTRGKEYLRTRQGEIGVGGYWKLGDNWLLSALGGAGSAATNRRYCAWGCSQLEGGHYKIFGQVGAAYEGRRKTSSLTYRLARVEYSRVKDGEVVLANFGTYRHELVLADRWQLGSNPAWFWQSTAGVSLSNLYSPSSKPTAPQNQDDRWYAAGLPALLVSFGVGWQPQR